MEAFGLEEGDDGVDGFHGGGAEIRVLGEGLACVDAHDFEAEDFLFEVEGEFRVGGRIERVLLEEGFGFGVQWGVWLLGIWKWRGGLVGGEGAEGGVQSYGGRRRHGGHTQAEREREIGSYCYG